ncbi:Histidine-containing phosphotransfer protein 4 [Dendrobium catenatum]|uniref:Histidine-containing phosphotransfer protein n=1 Tax=Dendrobium catenatum TaxID=906689 RepID=A0A2I0X556_9ASPA|nr:Histidine-containing phosphotransfer protein 4 [Dendrobium catenatum]
MDYSDLRRQAAYMKKSLFDQGYLDEQFYQLEDLQDDVSPNFVEEVVTLFFKDSSRLLSNIEQALEKNSPDFQKLDSLTHQLKGSTSSIGALKVKNECTLLREYCNKENLDGCFRTFQKVKREHAILRQKLEAYFQVMTCNIYLLFCVFCFIFFHIADFWEAYFKSAAFIALFFHDAFLVYLRGLVQNND